MDDYNDLRIEKKCQRNKISFLLIRFFAGLCDITDIGVKYYYKDIKELDTTTFTKILLVIKIPYLIKPIYGLLIDFVPIFGYKKRNPSYIRSANRFNKDYFRDELYKIQNMLFRDNRRSNKYY